jgi:hypothetical protein
MATCPLCSSTRRTAQSRHAKCLAVTLVELEFAVYFCNHCDAKGYCRPATAGRIIDLAERRAQEEAARRHAQAEKEERTRKALQLWDEAQSFRYSPAEDYLRNTRGIGDWLDTFRFLDQVFRFHPDCVFGIESMPCLVSLIRNIETDKPQAIHRTALRLGRRPERIERKSFGPVSGGAIKISSDHEVHGSLLIGEGIETVLSASKLNSFRPVWSLLDKNGVARFPALSGIESVTIAADNDRAGRKAANECAVRLRQGRIEVRIDHPDVSGADFNDVLLSGGNCEFTRLSGQSR